MSIRRWVCHATDQTFAPVQQTCTALMSLCNMREGRTLYKIATFVTLGMLPLSAAAFDVTADRILGVYGNSEYGENDWNADGFSDLAVLAISSQGDAVDVYLATSDPETGLLDVTDVAYGILPYDRRATYGIGPGHEAYEPVVSYQTDSRRTLYLSINARGTASGVLSVSTFAPADDATRSTQVCEFMYVDLYGSGVAPRAMVLGPDGVKTEYALDQEPVLMQWTWRDLPNPCLP